MSSATHLHNNSNRSRVPESVSRREYHDEMDEREPSGDEQDEVEAAGSGRSQGANGGGGGSATSGVGGAGDAVQNKRKIACMGCRMIKLRCLYAHNDAQPLDPCRRCSRLGLECVYKPKRRPVKPGQTDREEQPILSRNGVLAPGVNMAAAGSPAQSKRKANDSGLSQGRREESVKRRGERESGSASGSGERKNGGTRSESIPSNTPAPVPPVFHWSDYNTASHPSSSSNTHPYAVNSSSRDLEPTLTRSAVPSPFGGPGTMNSRPIPPGLIDPTLTAGWNSPSNPSMSMAAGLGNYGLSPSMRPPTLASGSSSALPLSRMHSYDAPMHHPHPHHSMPSESDIHPSPSISGSVSTRDRDTYSNSDSYERHRELIREREREADPSGSEPPVVTRYPMALTNMLSMMRKNVSAERESHSRTRVSGSTGAGGPGDADYSVGGRASSTPSARGGMGGGAGGEYGNNSALTDGDGRYLGSSSTYAQGKQPEIIRRPSDREEMDDESGHGADADRPKKRMRWDDAIRAEAEEDIEMRRNRRLSSNTQQSQHEDSPHHLEGRTRGHVHTHSVEEDDDLDSESKRGTDSLDGERADTVEDPVALGLVSSEDVPYLYEKFFNNLNTYIALLDPQLHTPEYVIRTSFILHTALLTVTAQTYLPEKYDKLRSRTNAMLGQAFAKGDAEIGLCQALSLLSVWKPANDKGSYLRVGYAIRLAYELGLNQTPKRPLPADPLKAREVLNGERTFRQLAAFDRTMYILHGRGERMISPSTLATMEQWCLNHPEFYCYSDSMLTVSCANGLLFEHIFQLQTDTSAKMDDLSLSFILASLRRELHAWQSSWFGPLPPAILHPTSRAIAQFYALNADFEISQLERRILSLDNGPYSLAKCIRKAIDLLNFIVSDLVPSDVIIFAPDVITFRAASAGVFLARQMPYMDQRSVDEVQTVFRNMIRECKRFARGHNTSFYQAKFFNSLLRIASAAPSRVISRGQSPGLNGLTGGMDTSVTPDELSAKLKEAVNPAYQNDIDLVGFDDPLTIDALLQESHDWFSLDMLSHMNDPLWNPPPVITGYDQNFSM